jgi:hypothetical protein
LHDRRFARFTLAVAVGRVPTLRAAALLWIGVYLLFSARAAGISALMPGSDPWPAAHAAFRLVVCAFGAALCGLIGEALRPDRHSSNTIRGYSAAALAVAGATMFTFVDVVAYEQAFGIQACTREISNLVSMVALIFGGWAGYSLSSREHLSSSAPAVDEPRAEAAIWVQERTGRYRLRADEILWIKAERECVRIYTKNGSHLVRGSLRNLEQGLGADFLRVHRSAVIRISAVVAFRRSAASMELELIDGSLLTVGRAFRSLVRRTFRNG